MSNQRLAHLLFTDSTDSHLTQRIKNYRISWKNSLESAEKAFGDNAHQMIENLLYSKMPPHLKKSINQAYLENGTYDQIVKHLELNGLEADEPLVKTQMTASKKEQNTEKTNKKQNEKPKKQTPKTVPDKTLKNNQCRYCKEAGHIMADCPQTSKTTKTRRRPGCSKMRKLQLTRS